MQRTHGNRAVQRLLSVGRGPAWPIADPQRALGNRATQRLLAERGHPPASSARSDGPAVSRPAAEPGRALDARGAVVPVTVQRKIGFEFEADRWMSARLTRPLSFHELAQPPEARLIHPTTYQWLTKKQPIYAGQGFTLEADETHTDDVAGRKKSDIEFVTVAFDESRAGLKQLQATLGAIVRLCDRLVGLRDAGSKAGNFNWPDELQAIGIPSTDLMLESGDRPMTVKMQATAGLRLDQIATVMASLGTARPDEPAKERQRRAPGRDLLTKLGRDDETGKIVAREEVAGGRIFGQAPAEAERAIRAFIYRHSRPGAPAEYIRDVPRMGETDSLRGILALIYSYLKLGAVGGSYPKVIAPLMARTDFARLFMMLPTPQKLLFRERGRRLWLEIVQETVQMPLDAPILAPSTAFTIDLTRELWIDQMAMGADLLTEVGYKALADSQLPPHPTPDEVGDYLFKQQQAEWLESMGSYGSKTEKSGQADAAIMELRAMPNYIDYRELKTIAVNLAKYVANVNRGKNRYYGER
jgi:hypothetical protein